MDQTPLVIDEIEAGAEFIKRLNVGWPVQAACWLREEERFRYLYVALDGLNETNTGEAYREVRRLSQEMKEYYIDPFRVKLIRLDHPIARALLDIYQRFAGRRPPYSDGPIFAGKAVVETYIYPPLPAMP
jgi:hypothetical protein